MDFANSNIHITKLRKIAVFKYVALIAFATRLECPSASDTPVGISTEQTSNQSEPIDSSAPIAQATKKKSKNEIVNEEVNAVALDYDDCIQTKNQSNFSDQRHCNKYALSKKSGAVKSEVSYLRIINNTDVDADVVCTEYRTSGGYRNFHYVSRPRSGEYRTTFNNTTKCSFRANDRKKGKLVVIKTIETLPKIVEVTFVESKSGKISTKLDFDPTWPVRR